MGKRREYKWDKKGRLTKMAEADGYVMCRRAGCIPFVLPIKRWNSMHDTPLDEMDPRIVSQPDQMPHTSRK